MMPVSPQSRKVTYRGLLDWITLISGKSLSALMRLLPERLALGIAKICVSGFCIIFHRAKGVGRRNLELVFPEKVFAEREKILNASFEILAKNLLAFATIEKLKAKEVATMIDNSELHTLIEQAHLRAPGVGVILAAMHFGCFEFFAQAQALLDHPTAILARASDLKRFDRWYHQKRELFGNEVFSRHGGFQETLARLKNSQDVMILIDQNVKANHACFVDFFGIKTATSKMVAMAALRTGAAVIFVVGVEISLGRYKLIVKALPDPRQESGSVEEKIQRFTQQLSNCMEEVIREFPEHWFWVHRRFKTRPPGEAEVMYR